MNPQSSDIKTLGDVINLFVEIGLALIPFMGAVAFVTFLFGVAKFIKTAGNEKEIKDSKKLLIWGVIGMFVMATIWGIITFLKGEFNFPGGVGIPQIKVK
jgi:hypothetical protein